jgi:enoyl-CoA hydratase
MEYQTILVEVGTISTCTINRPDKLNALNEEVLRELLDFNRQLRDNRDVRGLILTGAGDKAFIAGADIAYMSKLDVRGARAFAEMGHRVCDSFAELEFPVVAAVNGFALGGGTEVALACDFIYASKKAKFGQPEVKLGVIPGFGGTQRLARRVGIGNAKEIIFLGDTIGAEQAFCIGLVNAVCEPEELLPRVRKVLEGIAARGPAAVGQAKRAIDRGYDLSLDVANEIERALFAGLFATNDQKEGMAAFVEKREAKFENR